MPTEEGLLACIRSTVSRYVAERVALGELAKGTAKNARWILGDFADAVGPKMAVGKLGREHVERWLMGLTVSANTKYSRLCTVRAFTRWCVAHKLLRIDPCANIRGPSRPKGLPRSVDRDGILRLLHECDERLSACVLLGVQEGLRRAEIAGLSTSDVDIDGRLLRVTGKGSKERMVPLSDETFTAIDTYLRAFPAGPHRPLFRSYNRPDSALVPDTIGISISRAMRAAGVKAKACDGKSAHALRHTCANDMLDHGADIRDVSEMLGHSHLSSTEIYLRRAAATGRLRKAASGRRYSRLTVRADIEPRST